MSKVDTLSALGGGDWQLVSGELVQGKPTYAGRIPDAGAVALMAEFIAFVPPSLSVRCSY